MTCDCADNRVNGAREAIVTLSSPVGCNACDETENMLDHHSTATIIAAPRTPGKA